MMNNKPVNSGKKWTPQEIKKLEDLAEKDTPTRVIGIKLGRSEDAIYSKASEEIIPLKPTNQSPFGTKKK